MISNSTTEGLHNSLIWDLEKNHIHPVFGSCISIGLAKIRRNQIRSTEVISNEKHMSEGISSLM